MAGGVIILEHLRTVRYKLHLKRRKLPPKNTHIRMVSKLGFSFDSVNDNDARTPKYALHGIRLPCLAASESVLRLG